MTSLRQQLEAVQGLERIEPIHFSLDEAVNEKWVEKAITHCQQNAGLVDVAHFYYPSTQGMTAGVCVMPKRYEGKLPCIIFNRGGHAKFGALNQRSIFGFMAMIAIWGYCVIGSQYAGNDGSDGKDEFGGKDVDDVINLKHVLDHLAVVDPRRIGMIGLSRGAINSWLALTRVDWVKTVVFQGGVFDLAQMAEDRPEMKAIFQSYFGGSVEAMNDRSMIRNVDKLPKDVPMLILHGAEDVRVNPRQAIQLSNVCLDHAIKHRVIVYEDSDHDIHERGKEKNQEIKKWFERYVMLAEPNGQSK